MEMIMSAISSAPAAVQGTAGRSWVRKLVATLERWLVACMTWRTEQVAIAHLWSMSNRELKDIGLNRSEITGAVRGEAVSFQKERLCYLTRTPFGVGCAVTCSPPHAPRACPGRAPSIRSGRAS
jgi:uncharacterized protein YjiS (DUF1127 family)